MECTSGRAFYQRQIAALETHDLEALMTQYHPDASMVGFDFIVKGHIAIKKHFEGSMQKIIVQECYLRWAQASPKEIHSTKSYLTTIVTHLCLDYLKSARRQRELHFSSAVVNGTPGCKSRLWDRTARPLGNSRLHLNRQECPVNQR